MHVDQWLLILALASYVTGALAFVAFFLTRSPAMRAVGMPLAVIGCVAQFAELGARWQISGIWPLTNLYGSLSLFSALAVAIFLIFAFRYDMWFAGGLVLLVASIGLGYATTWNEGYMPAVPALQSYWIKIHVPLVIGSYASFMVAFVLSLIYLLKSSIEARYARKPMVGLAAAGGGMVGVSMSASYAAPSNPPVRIGELRGDTPALAAAAANGDILAQWMSGFPSLSKLDILTYRVVAVGLPLLTIGIITGAMWAKEAWGAYWQWDPKETAALISWIVYAAYMHLRTRNSWRGARSAWVNVLGFATIIFCYLGVNIWISGLHSYKM